MDRACHPQPLRMGQRPYLGAQFDLPRALGTVGHGHLGHIVDEVHPLGIRARGHRRARTRPSGGSKQHRSLDLHRRPGADGERNGCPVMRRVGRPSGTLVRATGSAPTAGRRGRRPRRSWVSTRRVSASTLAETMSTGADLATDGSGNESSTSSVQRSCSPVASVALTRAARLGSDALGRPRRSEQVEIGIAPIVERPPTWHHHRVGVTSTQHATGPGIVIGEHVEPEHQVFCEHPVGDRRQIGASGASAQAFHQRRHYSGRGLRPVDRASSRRRTTMRSGNARCVMMIAATRHCDETRTP